MSSGEAQSRWGVSREDLATYYWQDEENGREIIGSDGGEAPLTVSGVSGYYTVPMYQGSFEGVDYFLAYESVGSGVGSVGYILASRDGGRTLALDTTYPLGVRSNSRQPTEDLRIGPDGTKYLIVHYQLVGDTFESLIYEVESGGLLRELGRTPPGLVLGVAGGNNLPFLSAEFDSAGNMHAAYRGSMTADDNSTINVYYQFFPRSPIRYDSVALMTVADCAGCVAAAEYLRDAGVAFSENPADLPPDVAASVAVEVGSAGYPVLVRIGDETVVRGGADVASISRLLGLSHPVLIESYAPRLAEGSSYRTVSPQWLLMVVEDDQPRVVVDRTDGVVALSLVDGQWRSSPLLSTPDSVSDTPSIGFAKHYPAFPGGSGAGFYSTQQEKSFNHIDRLADFVYLYHSASTAVLDPFGESNVQQDYTLWTTEGPEESSAYRIVELVSQLIPATVFYVALGDKGTAGSVSGDLANYVTSEQEVSDDGDRFYRIVADLRAQGETATAGSIVGRTIGGSVTVDTETSDGAPETREISLLLLVQNTRLRSFDPAIAFGGRDITSEAVHFTGEGEHWLVTNNIGLSNSIPCGPDQWLVLDPFSYSTFTAADVASFELQSCLDALEVAPTVLAECDSWDDAKLVLVGETITSLAGSLPIMRSEDQTNWELSYGNRDATLHRIVSLDRPRSADGAPACADETGANSAIVVRISGPFLGSAGQDYAPNVSIVKRGTAAVVTATKDQPGSLAWEREWLEFESATLEANLMIDFRKAALASLWYDRGLRRLTFQRHLLATRALLHCNHQGIGLARVRAMIDRNEQVAAASRDTFLCLSDFVVHPQTYWPTYSPDYWSGGRYEADHLGGTINDGLTENPTLQYLAATSGGDAIDYGEFLIRRTSVVAGFGQQGAALDFLLDIYARIGSAAAKELVTYDDRLLKVAFRLDQLERTALNLVDECVRSMPGDQPLAEMIRLTSSRVYRPGIPMRRHAPRSGGQARPIQDVDVWPAIGDVRRASERSRPRL